MCKKLTSLNSKSLFYGKDYKFIIFDINSLTIVPHLNNELYLNKDSLNITPFIKTIDLYINYKKIFPNAKFIFITDSGISPYITSLYPKYKSNRNCRRTTNEFENKKYDLNLKFLKEFFVNLNEYFITDIFRNESDFIIGYILNKLSVNNKCLCVSHDKDLLLTFNKNNNIDIIYKDISSSYVSYYYIDNFECLTEIIDFRYIKNEIDLLYYKALLGDKSDNIPKPFGIKSKTIINNMFIDCYLNDIKITYDYILNYFKSKFKTDQIFNIFEKDFRRNIAIMNIFNSDVLSLNDQIKLNSYINEFLFFVNSKEINIENIYYLFERFNLHYQREDLDKMFIFLKGKN